MDLNNMTGVEEIRRQVQHNCDISDALHCGALSLCSFLLLIRNHYKWFHHMQPWAEGDPAATLEWIDQQEKKWEQIQEDPFIPVGSGDERFDPYELDKINFCLKDTSLVYGAGYAFGMKPTFFLAEMERIEHIDGNLIIFLGPEHARDMLALPALRQEERIYVRRESARYYLYDKIVEHFTAGKKPMLWAMKNYGVQGIKDLKHELDSIVDSEVMAMAYHEMGEAAEEVFGENWAKMVALFPMTSVERFARSLKDVLADTHPRGLLSFVIRERLSGILGLYVSMLDGFPKLLFPEIRPAFERFMLAEDWELIEAARGAGYENGRSKARQLMQILGQIEQKGKDAIREEMEYLLIKPLYCDKS